MFALAHQLGILLMSGIRNISDLTFYRPEKEVRFQNIEPLCSRLSIDWERIATHYQELLRVAVSIEARMMTPCRLRSGSRGQPRLCRLSVPSDLAYLCT